ncbi:hypothetical protein D7Z54_19425 [Salibacterium salarium]|uniref:Cytosolic protein n=1 Tax=Salibacterium salarium TaxID=284579 RepID=A0A3R9QIS0_9BACI|nr:hypothetical protein [Salibacterium salarium]RSL31619.1 hypothetical protein D7Z54_19425 [Salibacterium salarium]
MYNGRDFSELSMTSKQQWSEQELAHFHECFQQILPYLNEEGGVIYREILEEIKARPSFQPNETDWNLRTEF